MRSVLFLHGFMGRGDDWTKLQDVFGANVGVLAPDLPGHGSALGGSSSAYTMDGASDLLGELLNDEQIQQTTVIGYSMGGRLALHFALRHPERVGRLALISASPGLKTEGKRLKRRELDRQRATEIERDLSGFLERWYTMPLFASLENETKQRLIRKRSENDPAGLTRSLEGMGLGTQPSHWEHLQNIRVPAWAIAGANDPKFVSIAHEMASVSSIEAVAVPDAGHAIPSERPQALAELLRELLSTY